MIIVTGSAQARFGHLDEVLRLSREHVRRSRTEPGCLLHTVHRDVELPARLVFLEHWADLDALRAHFARPESRAIAKSLAVLADHSSIEIYDATPVKP